MSQQFEFTTRAIDKERDDFFRLNDFNCGDEGLNDFLHGVAFRYHKKGLGKTYLIINDANNDIMGYYTLRCNGLPYLDKESGMQKIKPVVEITRFAIDCQYQNQKLGITVLARIITEDIIEGIVSIIGVEAVYLLSLESAIGFYEKVGFEELSEEFQQLIQESDVGDECKAMVLALPGDEF